MPRLPLLLAAALLAGCAIEPDDACGPAMRYEASLHACVCDDDAIRVGGGCEVCPDGEVPSADQASCVRPAVQP